MNLLKWAASLVKNFSFFVTGSGVAINLATPEVSPTASTVGNFIAIGGGSTYSIFKNLKTTISIAGDAKYSCEIFKRLYYLTNTQDIEEVLRRLEVTQEKINSLKTLVNAVIDSANSTKRAYLYFGINAAFQMLLAISSISIYTAMIKDNDDNIWDAPSISNLILIPLFIFTQYGTHSFFARKLRKINEKATTLKQELKGLENSYSLRTLNLRELVRESREKQNSLVEIYRIITKNFQVIDDFNQQLRDFSTEKYTDDSGMEKRHNEITDRLCIAREAVIRNQKVGREITEKLDLLHTRINVFCRELREDFACFQRTQQLFDEINQQSLDLFEDFAANKESRQLILQSYPELSFGQ